MKIKEQFETLIESIRETSCLSGCLHKVEALAQYYADPCRVLIMGEFSAGKSSILNACMGKAILPVGITMTTAIVTFIRFGIEERIEICYGDGRKEYRAIDELATFSSELAELGSETLKAIEFINVYVNHALLKEVVLIDSPGLNSTISSHTNQTRQIRNLVDEVVWVFAYRQVGKSTELREISKLNGMGLRPLAVINKIDESPTDDITPYLSYEREKLQEYIQDIIGVSAMEAASALEEGDGDLYALSGFPDFTERLLHVERDISRKRRQVATVAESLLQSLLSEIRAVLTSTSYRAMLKRHATALSAIESADIRKRKEWNIGIAEVRKNFSVCSFAMEEEKFFSEWILLKETSFLAEYVPYEKWRVFANQYEQVASELQVYRNDAYHFERQHITGFGYTSRSEKRSVERVRSDYRVLTDRRKKLNNQLIRLHHKLKDITHELEWYLPTIGEAYQKRHDELAKRLNGIEIDVVNYERHNKDSFKQAKRVFADVENLPAVQLAIIDLSASFLLGNDAEAIRFPHMTVKEAADEWIVEFYKRINKLRKEHLHVGEWNPVIHLPEKLQRPERPKNQLLTRQRLWIAGGLSVGIGITILAALAAPKIIDLIN